MKIAAQYAQAVDQFADKLVTENEIYLRQKENGGIFTWLVSLV